MREQIDTIPVNDAFDAGDECPFCYLERRSEQMIMRYVAGPCASYMEPDVRAVTDKKGFCNGHMKKLYDYGNTLGAALMLQTHMAGLLEQFQLERENYAQPAKKKLFGKNKVETDGSLPARLQERVQSCYFCDRIEQDMHRYYATFFALIQDPEFRKKVESGKGFCLRHFAQLLEKAEGRLPGKHQAWFYETVFSVMEENLVRVKGDLDWLVAKYDYRNAGADWKNSRDALPRTMQKLQGIYPADPPYKKD